ncbi:MAG: aminomethyl-transferring glycine dehydrogenase subunit GcvPA [Candidatus Izemoplasmatales bacterium]|nr:aminomethyl-transferring glycine dehydrogenase subunit GcvPA [Candidatus Izemoplasmatales bacterium]MDY0373232.1 aminomethyl-transferring glycine dehydrogenase subunit GcvPA [Candidatus Izemoplasmatales bacterium]
MFKYFPHTPDDLAKMQDALGIKELNDLFRDVPKDVFFQREYQLPSALSEAELRSYFEAIANENQKFVCFAGMGVYDHIDPAVVKALTSRQEFLTAYTPYQPEVSQGTLQYIFEFQSMIQTLTGMDAANASMYDGATATAEAAFMAEAITKRKRILISNTVNPNTVDTIKTYAYFKGLEVDMVPEHEGVTDTKALKEKLTEDIACLIVQKPNMYGVIEMIAPLSDLVHAQGGILIENADISTLGVLKTPREEGADIACGDCQSLGLPMAFGGPSVGYLATLKNYVRKLPGRIVGMSKDQLGRRAFVLTLQAREQHIRREKANSNICSNQSLMALAVTIYLATVGPEGLKKVNELSYQGAHYLMDRLEKTGYFQRAFAKPFLKEFVVRSMIPLPVLHEALFKNNLFGAIPVAPEDPDKENLVSFAVTEKRSKAEIDRLIEVLEGLSW